MRATLPCIGGFCLTLSRESIHTHCLHCFDLSSFGLCSLLTKLVSFFIILCIVSQPASQPAMSDSEEVEVEVEDVEVGAEEEEEEEDIVVANEEVLSAAASDDGDDDDEESAAAVEVVAAEGDDDDEDTDGEEAPEVQAVVVEEEDDDDDDEEDIDHDREQGGGGEDDAPAAVAVEAEPIEVAAVVVAEDEEEEDDDDDEDDPPLLPPKKKTPKKSSTTKKSPKKQKAGEKKKRKKRKARKSGDGDFGRISSQRLNAADSARQMLLESVRSLPANINESFVVRSFGQLHVEASNKFSTANALFPVGFCCDRYEFSPVHGRVLKLRCAIIDPKRTTMEHDGPIFRVMWGQGVDEDVDNVDYPYDPYSNSTPISSGDDVVALPVAPGGSKHEMVAPTTGMRVKVRFDQNQFYYGTLIGVEEKLDGEKGKKKSISITVQYDDGSIEDAPFPDPDISLVMPGKYYCTTTQRACMR